MYLWLKDKTHFAALGACLYMAAPYHLGDFYVRAALAEFAGFVWLPLIALALEAQPKRWAAPLLALAFAGLLVSHLPMAVLATCFLIGPMVIMRAWREKTLGMPRLRLPRASWRSVWRRSTSPPPSACRNTFRPRSSGARSTGPRHGR